jgi:nucleotide-binding universal stress UspA family protein
MFNKILVAADNSAMGKRVFQEALFLATATGANLQLLHVLSPNEEGSPGLPIFQSLDYYPTGSDSSLEIYQQEWEAYERKGLEFLRSREAEANAAGVNIQGTQVSGSPEHSICNLARTWDADLIVLGNRGRKGWSELFLGSVSNYVVHHAPCSVFVVRFPISMGSETTESTQTEATSI